MYLKILLIMASFLFLFSCTEDSQPSRPSGNTTFTENKSSDDGDDGNEDDTSANEGDSDQVNEDEADNGGDDDASGDNDDASGDVDERETADEDDSSDDGDDASGDESDDTSDGDDEGGDDDDDDNDEDDEDNGDNEDADEDDPDEDDDEGDVGGDETATEEIDEEEEEESDEEEEEDDDDNDKIDTETDSDECDSLLEITVRDFDESHPDMQRDDLGWGPLAGVLELELGPDRKPIFYDIDGTHTWHHDTEDGILVKNCWDSGPGTEEECYRGEIPMFDGEESFYDWYHDTEYNMTFEKQIQMEVDPSDPTVFVYDNSDFFPLSPDEGFGITPSFDNGKQENYLFTTEIHLLFTYREGQRFTFRGDDDLWIFVNDQMALDIGGLHIPFEATIDFDAQAEELGISPGKTYHMDIFHAERHTTESNFRIETNISCFVPVIVV